MRSAKHEMKTEYLIGKGMQAGGCRIIPIIRKVFFSFVNKSSEGVAMGGICETHRSDHSKRRGRKEAFLVI